ncbi:MAG: hypothetical protein R3251_03115, partial [Candidatus Spechtbacterales bacterium]|nr:hypothetical protein [Candidatus Spechtbacterales bacterium]
AYFFYGITPGSIIDSFNEPEFKYDTEYSTGNSGFTCSEPIKLQRKRMRVQHLGGSNIETRYLPVDSKKAESVCQMAWIE